LVLVLIAFYLILDVAVGGTNGWFPDGAGNKPWLNGALGMFLLLGSSPTVVRCLSMYADAMQTFAQAEDKWYKTWPSSEEDRAMRMYVISTLSTGFENRVDRFDTISDYVKMWEQC
jgi:hypothetical protein